MAQTTTVQREFDPKDMPFRRLGPSGLRVPVFSLGGCKNSFCLNWILSLTFGAGLTLGGSVLGDPVKVVFYRCYNLTTAQRI